MIIKLLDEHKSLKPFESELLNDLTIITGKNGSGKSQLLDLIGKKAKNDPTVTAIRFETDPNFTKIQAEGIIKENSTQIGHDQWKAIVKKNLDLYKGLSLTSKELIKYVIDNNYQSQVYDANRRSLITEDDDYKDLLSKVYSEIHQTPLIDKSEVTWKTERNSIRQIFTPQNAGLFKFIEEICSHTGKSESELSDADFYNTPLQEHLIDINDLFSSKVELIFYNYAKRRDLNRKDYFYKKEEGEENNSISDEEFVNNNTPPWLLFNGILERHDIDFHFKGIEKRDFTIEAPIDFNIYKKSTDQLIPFNDLSSGEKVIIGLILKLFTSEYYQEKLSFPELLILDEPDAHLHPEMSKLLLDVLNDTFVIKYGIRVMLSTHSPSTIALASENQIYQLKNGDDSSLIKISKDEALKILTSFIPTLSIDYKNHKQIFVESPTDRYYYQTMFDRLNQEKDYPFKLYFISNGYGKGNCQQVIDVVTEIRKSDNTTCFGVIDWDLSNTSTETIFVHGENSRYNIESYVYDPAFLMILFLEMDAMGVRNTLGLDVSFNEYTLGLDQELLQKSIDWFFQTYYEKFNVSQELQDAKREVDYYHGIKVLIPEWYLEFQGHDLEVKLKEAFIALQKFRNEGQLQKELTIISAKCFPMVHKDTVEMIDKIVNAG
ncbi:MAG: ATP-binding protein [Balneolaceae bacterium]